MIEIDGITLELEKPVTEACDYIADCWVRAIDLSTEPHVGSNILGLLASSVRRLNRNISTTSVVLVGTELEVVYDDVVGQLNEINAGRQGVDELKPLIKDNSRFEEYSGSFIWSD